ncbi:hypothetical protein HK405_014746, partial [Cladochytrium tenue]
MTPLNPRLVDAAAVAACVWPSARPPRLAATAAAVTASRCVWPAFARWPSTCRPLSSHSSPNLASATVAHNTVDILGRSFQLDATSNVGRGILDRVPRRLHLVPGHPLNILQRRIQAHFNARLPGGYAVHDALHPVVSPAQNFDALLVSQDHPSRSPSDTYYVNSDHVLRTHTSAHQAELLRSRQAEAYLAVADVYRRDEIDPTHYPVFHQVEGIRTFARRPDLLVRDAARESWLAGADTTAGASASGFVPASPGNPVQACHSPEESARVADHLRKSLEGLALDLFAHAGVGPDSLRWVDAYFPFTSPSWELEVLFRGRWLELLGCGVVRQEILDAAGCSDRVGWAFGLGLERIAMVLFEIPDIRLFWSADERFLSQFSDGSLDTRFQPYSKFPACYKDVSFWLPQPPAAAASPSDARVRPPFHDNDMFEIVRDVAGDLVEDVSLIDVFTNKKTGRTSKCYRINYRSMDRTLSNSEVDGLQDRVREELAARHA